MEKELTILFKEKKFEKIIEVLNNKKNLKREELNLKALCLYSLNDIDAAKELLNNLILGNNDYADPFINLGKILFSENNYEKAKYLLEKAKEINPKLTVTNIFLAQIEQKKGLLDNVENFFKLNIDLEPLNYYHYNNLGAFYHSNYQFKKSIVQFKKSLQIKRNFTALLALGNLYSQLNEIDESSKYYDNYLHYKKNPDVFYKLALNYFFTGKKGIGISLLKDAMHYSPLHTKSILYLSRIQELDSSLINKIIESFKNHGNQKEKANLGFALFNFYNSKKQYSVAAGYLKKANILVYESIKNRGIFDFKEEFNIYKKVFDKKINISNLSVTNTSYKPIFIVGMPRSGSTLIEQILSNHQSISVFGEINYLHQAIIKNIKSLELNNYEHNLKEVIHDPDKLREIRNYYLSFFEDTGKSYFTDKMLNNFRYIGLIKLIFPEAKIIYVKRNIKDNCFSIYANHFGSESVSWVYNEKEIVKYYNLHKDLMSHWFKIYDNEIYQVNYENLIENFESESKNIINYLNLNWDINCLKFNKSSQAAKTISSNQVRSELYKTSVDFWKMYEENFINFFKSMDSADF